MNFFEKFAKKRGKKLKKPFLFPRFVLKCIREKLEMSGNVNFLLTAHFTTLKGDRARWKREKDTLQP